MFTRTKFDGRLLTSAIASFMYQCDLIKNSKFSSKFGYVQISFISFYKYGEAVYLKEWLEPLIIDNIKVIIPLSPKLKDLHR